MSKSMLCAATVLAIAALSTATWAQPAPPTLQITPPAPVEKVVATVGDAKITNTDLDKMVQRQLQGRSLPPEVLENVRKEFLDAMIQNELVVQFLAANNVKAEPAKIEEVVASIKKQVASQGSDLATALKAQGMTEETLRAQIASQMAVEKYAQAEVTDEKADEYYKTHKAEFNEPRVKASHILLKYEPGSTPEEKKAANDKIVAIRQEITAGADFAEAAKQHSACPSKDQGGDLGFFPRHNAMVEPFAAAAFALEPGGISHPVETQFGVHLIKVTEVDSGEKEFDDVKDAVKSTLFQQLLLEVAEKQRKVTKVEIIN